MLTKTNGGRVSAIDRLLPPDGLAQIIRLFGDIQQYVLQDGTLRSNWQTEFLAPVELPFPLTLSFDHSKTITHFFCHKLLVEIFADVFAQVVSSGLQREVVGFGGCFAFRQQRTGTKLSTHCWGIAIDLNPETNQQGTAGDMDAGLIETFRGAGFEWGGDWAGTRRDGMHFQFCTGY